MRIALEGHKDFPRTIFILQSLIIGLKWKADDVEDIRIKIRICLSKKYGRTSIIIIVNLFIQMSSLRNLSPTPERKLKDMNSKGNLPDHFLTKFLEEQNIVLNGAEDIKILRTYKGEKGPITDRLRKLIMDLENGDAWFAFKSDAE